MHGFVRNLITEWRRHDLPFEGETLVMAVSGGADSVSLLLGISDLVRQNKLQHRIVAAHFNHGLRDGESDADEEYVRRLATDLNVELAVGHGNVSKLGNLEQNARDARYEFLTQTAKNLQAFAVLTGHTVNDQAETFLINLLRGSGVDGLSGMKAVRSFEVQGPGYEPDLKNPDLKLIRPLLTWAKRIDTEAYCRDSGVEYRYDTMNEDTTFKRVRIRKILLPLLEDFNPKIIETLANTANLMQNLAGEALSRNQSSTTNEIHLWEIRSLQKEDVCDAIRIWLVGRRGSARQMGLKHIQAVQRLIFSEKSGRMVELPGGIVMKSGGKLIYKENKVEN